MFASYFTMSYINGIIGDIVTGVSGFVPGVHGTRQLVFPWLGFS